MHRFIWWTTPLTTSGMFLFDKQSSDRGPWNSSWSFPAPSKQSPRSISISIHKAAIWCSVLNVEWLTSEETCGVSHSPILICTGTEASQSVPYQAWRLGLEAAQLGVRGTNGSHSSRATWICPSGIATADPRPLCKTDQVRNKGLRSAYVSHTVSPHLPSAHPNLPNSPHQHPLLGLPFLAQVREMAWGGQCWPPWLLSCCKRALWHACDTPRLAQEICAIWKAPQDCTFSDVKWPNPEMARQQSSQAPRGVSALSKFPSRFKTYFIRALNSA